MWRTRPRSSCAVPWPGEPSMVTAGHWENILGLGIHPSSPTPPADATPSPPSRARVAMSLASGRGLRLSGHGAPASERSGPLRNVGPTRLGNPPRRLAQSSRRGRRCAGQLGTAMLRKLAFPCVETETVRNPEDAAKAREHASERRSAQIGAIAFVASSPAIPTTRPVRCFVVAGRRSTPV